MKGSDIARRISFGASSIGFPMDKYLSGLDDILISKTNGDELAEKWQPQYSGEHHEAKEYFESLRYQFLELYVKEFFFQHLKLDPQDWDTEDVDFNELKSEFKQVKYQIDASVRDLMNLLDSIRNDKLKYEQGKRIIDLTLDQIGKAVDDDTGDQCLPKSAAPLPKSPSLIREELISQISNLAQLGIEIVDKSNCIIKLRLLKQYIAILEVVPDKMQIQSLEIKPQPFPVDDLVEAANESKDIHYLFTEIIQRIRNHDKLMREIDSLSARSECQSVEYNPQSSLVEVKFTSGIRAVVSVPGYPNKVSLSAVEGPIITTDNIQTIMNYFNGLAIYSLTQFVEVAVSMLSSKSVM